MERDPTALSTASWCPAPAKMQRQGLSLSAGSRLQARMVLSSEAETMSRGLSGDVAKSETSCDQFSFYIFFTSSDQTYAAMPSKTLENTPLVHVVRRIYEAAYHTSISFWATTS